METLAVVVYTATGTVVIAAIIFMLFCIIKLIRTYRKYK
jgi:hypothetical protein